MTNEKKAVKTIEKVEKQLSKDINGMCEMENAKRGGSSKRNNARRKARKKQSRMAGTSGPLVDAPVARGQQIRAAPQKSQRLRGNDRLLFISDLAKYGAREVIASVPFVPQLCPRLAKEAGAWQRIKYRKLRFSLVPQVGTASAGGTVLAFVKDSTDPIPEGEDGLQRLFAQDSSVASPIWEPSNIEVVGLRDLYYTNFNADEPRWSSPGSVCIMTEGKPSVTGSATLYCEYDVVFSAADVDEEDAEAGVGSIFVVELPKSNTIKTDNNENRLAADTGTGLTSKPDWSKVIKGAKAGDVLMCPTPRSYVCAKAISTVLQYQLATFKYVKYETNGELVPCGVDGTAHQATSLGYTDCFWSGEGFKLVSRAKTSDLNSKRGLKLLCCPYARQHMSNFLGLPNQEGFEVLLKPTSSP
nr:MAG: coat protein [Wufeng shrew permutotetravirus 1]